METSVVLEKLKTWLLDGLLLCSVLLLAIFMMIAIFVRLNALSDIAKFLPAEETEGFFVVNREDYEASSQPINSDFFDSILGHPFSELDWLGRDIAFASINGNWISFFQVDSKNSAQNFLDSLKTEGEEFTNYEENKNIQCYVSLPTCFVFVDDFLALSTAPESLALLTQVKNGAPNLAGTSDYQNARGRLPNLSSGFVYINLENARKQIIRYADKFGIPEPGFLESIFQIFPAFGASLRMENTGWYAESFVAVDKTALDGEAYYHPTEKYEQKFLTWTQPFAFEWGGQNIGAQLTRMKEIFAKLNSTASLVFESSVENWFAEIFGKTSITEENFLSEKILPLIDGEYYFGWTPGDSSNASFLAIIELDGEAEVQKAAQLKDLFSQNFRYKKTTTDSKGETRAELIPLTTNLLQYGDRQYYRFDANGQTVATISFLENAAIISSSEATLFATFDRISGGQSGRPLGDFMVLLPGSDEITILNSAFFGEVSIIVASTRKIFDDGVYMRTSLLP